jgi:pantoate--beta-alanine ligase
MQTVRTIAALRAAVSERRRAGQKVGFVPTMGFLHEGHLRLVDEARTRAECVVMSIFVNPLQFAPSEDLARYPRDPDGDSRKAEHRNVDILFMPEHSEIYPHGERVVAVVPLRGAERWEGEVRPGHFAGVLTVVAKLFNLVQPDVAVFGQKDAQQAALVRAMVRDLDFPIELVVSPIVRDEDGLALSSRNAYLDTEARTRALALPRALAAVREAYDSGERISARLEEIGRNVLATEGGVSADYLSVVGGFDMEPREVVILAARVGSTRLLDNLVLGAAE